MPLKDYESVVARAATPEAVWATFSEYFRDTVVDRVVYLHLPPVRAPDSRRPRPRAEGFPQELVMRYLSERLYRDNPALRHPACDSPTLRWSATCAMPASAYRCADSSHLDSAGESHSRDSISRSPY
jgi:hypothetical protein